MNKQKVDALIPKAYEAMQILGIAVPDEKGVCQISGAFRSYISTFGAAITLGSLTSAVASFSRTVTKSREDKYLLMDAIFLLLTGKVPDEADNLLLMVCRREKDREYALKEDILNAAIALKLAMNLCRAAKEEPVNEIED